jgi:hypothetical protein
MVLIKTVHVLTSHSFLGLTIQYLVGWHGAWPGVMLGTLESTYLHQYIDAPPTVTTIK